MKQRAVIGFLTLKGLNPEEIYSELESIYREDVLTHPTVYKCHERFRDWRTEFSDDPRSGKLRKSNLAEAISSMLQERPFALYRFLVRHFRIAKATGPRNVTERLGVSKAPSSMGLRSCTEINKAISNI
jgi:hypothetical protein